MDETILNDFHNVALAPPLARNPGAGLKSRLLWGCNGCSTKLLAEVGIEPAVDTGLQFECEHPAEQVA